MNRLGWVALALACLLAACVRTSDGVPVAGDRLTTAVSSAPPGPSQQSDESAYGVVPTTRAPVPPNTVACSQSIKPTVRMTVWSVCDWRS